MAATKEQVNLAELCLPARTEQYRYEGKESFWKIYQAQRRKKTLLYLVFYDIDLETYLRDFPETAVESFNPETKCMVIKMKSRQHQCAVMLFHDIIVLKLNEFDPPVRLRDFGEADFRGPERLKEADITFMPKKLPNGRSSEWPSFVVEVGFSEAERKLKNDAKWWLESSSGEVRRVVIIQVHQRREEIVLSSWILDRGTADENNRQVVLTQSIQIQRDDVAEVVNVGGSLDIPFEDLVLRPANTGEEEMVVLATQDLEDFATEIWSLGSSNHS